MSPSATKRKRKPGPTLSVRPETHAKLQAEAARRGVAIGELIRLMLDESAVKS